MPDNIVEICNVSKVFGRQLVLDNINLGVKSGEFLTLLGPSGCGKTTMLKLISGFEQPSTGQIFIASRDVSSIAPNKRHVNTVFQNYALFPHMSVFDNVAFGLRCQNLPRQCIEERVYDILTIVKLTHLQHRKPQQLSGGQQQRVAIARAVINKPVVLLLDEPLSALDYSLRKQMQIELKVLQRQLGITFIFVTHDQEEALSMSDRVVVMNHGIIEQIGTPRQVYEQPVNLHVATFIGQANVFDSEIISIDAKKIRVHIENHDFILENSLPQLKGKRVYIIVRPEDIRVWDKIEMQKRDNHRMLPALVEQVIYKGSTVDLILQTDNGKKILATEFFDEDDESLLFEIGEKVWFEWLDGWEVLLPVA